MTIVSNTNVVSLPDPTHTWSGVPIYGSIRSEGVLLCVRPITVLDENGNPFNSAPGVANRVSIQAGGVSFTFPEGDFIARGVTAILTPYFTNSRILAVRLHSALPAIDGTESEITQNSVQLPDVNVQGWTLVD